LPAGWENGLHSVERMEAISLHHQSEIEFAALTDVGCQRERNEDSSAYWQPESCDDLAHKGRLAVVADGMGGYEGGQEASQIAVQTVRETFANRAGTPQGLLVNGMRAAHERIREHARQHPKLFGMGTTCTAVAVARGYLYFAHVGDSRLYLVRAGRISRLTRDHSYVARLIESGLITASDAEAHPQRHILLCTDGLWGLVNDEELHKSAATQPPENACRELVALAKHRGAPDNITVQVLRYTGDGASTGTTTGATTSF